MEEHSQSQSLPASPLEGLQLSQLVEVVVSSKPLQRCWVQEGCWGDGDGAPLGQDLHQPSVFSWRWFGSTISNGLTWLVESWEVLWSMC